MSHLCVTTNVAISGPVGRIQRVQWPIAVSQTTEAGKKEKEKRDCGRFFDWDLAEEEEEGEENAQSPGVNSRKKGGIPPSVPFPDFCEKKIRKSVKIPGGIFMKRSNMFLARREAG